MASHRKIRRALDAAMAAQQLVSIERSLKFADRIDGFVVAIGAEWVLIQRTIDAGHFDAHRAIRTRDVSKVRDDSSFEGRMSRLLPEWPPKPPADGIDLDSTSGVLRTIGNGGLVAIEKEREREAMWIGLIESVTKKWLWLLEIDPKAQWEPAPLGYKLKAITSISVGGRYLAGLQTISILDAAARG